MVQKFWVTINFVRDCFKFDFKNYYPKKPQNGQQHGQQSAQLRQGGNFAIPQLQNFGLKFDSNGVPLTQNPYEIAQAVRKMEECLKMLNSLQQQQKGSFHGQPKPINPNQRNQPVNQNQMVNQGQIQQNQNQRFLIFWPMIFNWTIFNQTSFKP